MISSILEQLQQVNQKINQTTAASLLDSVSNSLQQNTFHIAVLGEFNRGKTTLINSLIGDNILYTDVLPATALIHVLEYGDTEGMEIWYTNGKKEQLPLEKEQLVSLSASQNIDLNSIKFVKIFLNHPMLHEGVVIIDTPGVNDLVLSRAEITSSILPHCDAALFLLDAAAPLTRSEAEFLQTKVYYHNLDQILFILSKTDRLKEDELLEAVEGAELRVKNVTGKSLSVYPYSSKMVLQHPSTSEEGMLQEQHKMWALIAKLRYDSHLHKEERNTKRLLLAVELLMEHLEWQQSIHEANEEQLNELSSQLDVLMLEVSVRFGRLLASIEQVGRQALLEMVKVSYDKFKETIINDLRYDIRARQSNLEKMLERDIPLYLEQQLRRFSEAKGSEIQFFIEKLMSHIDDEYQKHFRLPLASVIAQSSIPMPSWVASVAAGSNNQVQQVIKQVAPFTVGAAIGTIVFPGIGTILGGAVGMAYNAITKNKETEKVREELLSNVDITVIEIVETHHKETRRVIDDWFNSMLFALKEYHDEQYETLCQMIQRNQEVPNIQPVQSELPELLLLHDMLTIIRSQLSQNDNN